MIGRNEGDRVEIENRQNNAGEDNENEASSQSEIESTSTTIVTPTQLEFVMRHHQKDKLETAVDSTSNFVGLDSLSGASSSNPTVEGLPTVAGFRYNSSQKSYLNLVDHDQTSIINTPRQQSYNRSASFALPVEYLRTIPERDNEDDCSSMSSFAARSSTLGGNSSTMSFLETVKNNSLKKWWHVMSGGPSSNSTTRYKQKRSSSSKSQISGTGSNTSSPQVHPNSQNGSELSGSNGANISCVGNIPTFTSTNSLLDLDSPSHLIPRNNKKHPVTYALIFLALTTLSSIAAIVYLVTHPTEIESTHGSYNNDYSSNNPKDPKNPDQDTGTITIDIDVTQSESPARKPTTFPLTFSPPTYSPTHFSTYSPSYSPTSPHTKKINSKTTHPSQLPSKLPTKFPTIQPSIIPTHLPSTSPTQIHTSLPSSTPSNVPTVKFTQIQEELLVDMVKSHYSFFQPQNNAVHQISWHWFLYQDAANLPLSYIQLYENDNGNTTMDSNVNQTTRELTSNHQTLQNKHEKILVQRLVLVIICLELGFPLTESSQQINSNTNRDLDSEKPLFSNYHECIWKGIKCDIEPQQNFSTLEETSNFNVPTIISIEFNEEQLTGTIPHEFAYFQNSLISLSMYENKLFGPIKNLYPLKYLQYLDLAYNSLNGTLELHHFSNLEFIYLSSNELTGTLPLPQAMEVKYDYNDKYDYQKEIIAFVDKEKLIPFPTLRLEDIWLFENNFEGSIPPGIGALTQLQKLLVYRNDLTHHIPESIEYLTELKYLDLSYNQLEGEMPHELYSLTQLEALYVSGNEFTGDIFHEISSLSNLVYLWLDENKFTGYISKDINSLSNLKQLMLQYNQFKGSVPETVCTELTYLNQFWANCNDTHIYETYSYLECECCTTCVP